MKKSLVVVALLGAGLVGCDKLKNLATISTNVNYSAEVDMPLGVDSSITVTGDTTVNIPFVYATNADDVLSNNNTSSDKLISAELSKLSMKITQPATQNFDFLDTVRVYLSADGLPEVLAAKQYPIGKGLQKVDMDTTGVALKPYFLQDSVRIRLNAHANALPMSGTKLSLNSTFRITANPLN